MQINISHLQDRLTGAIIALANAAEGHGDRQLDRPTVLLAAETLAASGNCFDADVLQTMTARVRAEKARVAPDCAACKSPCGRTQEYDLRLIYASPEDVRTPKMMLLSALRNMAPQIIEAAQRDLFDDDLNAYFFWALRAIGDEWDAEHLAKQMQAASEMLLRCRILHNV